MKYVYTDQKIDRGIPENVPVRLLVGTLMAGLTIALLYSGFVAWGDVTAFVALLLSGVISGVIAFLIIFFAIRTIIVTRCTRTRTPETVIAFDEEHPFYSSRCPNCLVLIDYQRSDLAYRLWFRKGYVECPCCHKPIGHDSENNRFIPHRIPE